VNENGRAGVAHRVALVVHPSRQEAKDLASQARQWWEARAYEVVEADGYSNDEDRGLLKGDLDFAVSLGGDGTMLRTVQLVVDRGVPVLGVNLGSLGYLTQIEPRGIEEAFSRLVSGEFEIEERMTLEVTVEASGTNRATYVVLNEVSVEKTAPGHTIRIGVSIDESPFLVYVADGIVIATPTGSTAYNLSLRGPIVSPRLRAIVVTAISPHMLFDRSLVLEPEESVRLEILDERPAVLVVDGVAVKKMDVESTVAVRTGTNPARIVHFGVLDFHSILRQKFGLAGR
jgi:NAD+ kinase